MIPEDKMKSAAIGKVNLSEKFSLRFEPESTLNPGEVRNERAVENLERV